MAEVTAGPDRAPAQHPRCSVPIRATWMSKTRRSPSSCSPANPTAPDDPGALARACHGQYAVTRLNAAVP
jgi:hypothetical protein